MSYIDRDTRDRLNVLEEEVQEIRAQGEAIRIREQNLQQRYARLQARYTYTITRLDALEKEVKLLRARLRRQETEAPPAIEDDMPARSIKPEVKKRELIEDSDHLLSLAEAADMAGISIRALSEYVRSGDLEATKIKGQWRIRPEDMKSFLETHTLRRRYKKENEEEDYND